MSEPVSFTPGPWQASPGGLVVHSVDDELVAEVFEGDPYVAKVVAGPSLAEQIANSRLIAAAPALYEALEAMLGLFPNIDMGRMLKEKFGLDTRQNDIVDAARAALALARGAES